MSAPIRASTQDHLDIDDIHDNVVLLKDGGACLVIRTTAVNFGLLSEAEQDAIIYAFVSLLNSLTFPIQIVLRSKFLDISSYLDRLKEAELKQANERRRTQIARYRAFVAATIQENNVLDKRFYIIIPFSPVELGIRSGFSLFGKKRPPYSKTYILEKAKYILFPRRDHVLRQLARIGLRGKEATTEELISLYYEIYNPTASYAQEVGEGVSGHTAALVRPAVDRAATPVPQSPTSSPLPRPQQAVVSQPHDIQKIMARLDATLQTIKQGAGKGEG